MKIDAPSIKVIHSTTDTTINTRKCELYFNEFNDHKTYRYFS